MKHTITRILFLAAISCFLAAADSSAGEITILYTGETHAMLYPCSCPIEKDGGIARRAALVKGLRKDNPNLILLDSGGFFAGGMQDEYALNRELDIERTLVNFKAMELMGYDAVAVGDEEFNFGADFLRKNIAKSRIAFLSSNITAAEAVGAPFKPYIIKESAGKRIGIIGLSNILAAQKAEAGGLKAIEPKAAVKDVVSQLKKNKADIIILLSHMGESQDMVLLKEIEGIDILIVGHSRSGKEIFSRAGRTLILRPAWQGRSMGKLTIDLTDGDKTNYKVEEFRLSDEVSDDPGVLSILPDCFSEKDCRQEGSIARCDAPGTLKSRCVFTKAEKVPLLVIMPKACKACSSSGMESYLKTLFPGLSVSYLYYPGEEADKLIGELEAVALPVYLLGKEAEREEAFAKLKTKLIEKGGFYMLDSQFAGIAYYIDRKPVKGRLDLFMSLYDKNAAVLLDTIKDFKPVVHFLAVENENGEFEAKGGNPEVEECLRSVCVQKYYPRKFWDYISCRAKSSGSSWWQDCLDKNETDKIGACARSKEGRKLLSNNIALNKELKIMFGPVYLLDNREIFSSHGVPPKEELKRIIER